MVKKDWSGLTNSVAKDFIRTPTAQPGEALLSARELPLDLIDPNPRNARKDFDESGKLQDLMASIEQDGVLEPIVVRSVGKGRYQIIAGERRYRACLNLKKETISVVIKDMSDEEARRVSLIENIQRADLSPVDEADAYKMLMEEMGLSIRELAAYLNKSKSYIEIKLSVANAPEDVRNMVAAREDTQTLVAPLSKLSKRERLPIEEKIKAGATNKEAMAMIKPTKKVSGRQDTMPHETEPVGAGQGSGIAKNEPTFTASIIPQGGLMPIEEARHMVRTDMATVNSTIVRWGSMLKNMDDETRQMVLDNADLLIKSLKGLKAGK